MSAREFRASLALAPTFGLRPFGMFIIPPVFALTAERLPGGNLTLAGNALGAVDLLGISRAWLVAGLDRRLPMTAALVIFFAAFNVLERRLHALLSKAAPPSANKAASGVDPGAQFPGTFVSGAVGRETKSQEPHEQHATHP
jgi:hypothetical protein